MTYARIIGKKRPPANGKSIGEASHLWKLTGKNPSAAISCCKMPGHWIMINNCRKLRFWKIVFWNHNRWELGFMGLADNIKLGKPFSSRQEGLMLELIHTADMLWRQLADFLKNFGLSPTQYNALRILRGAGDEGLACGEVSARMVTREPDIT